MSLFLRRASILDILNLSILPIILAFSLSVAGQTPTGRGCCPSSPS